MKEFTRESIHEAFVKNTTLTVVFTKKNGDKRMMSCTQSLNMIPVESHPKSHREPSETTCTVYEFGVGWRSFKYDSVIEVL